MRNNYERVRCVQRIPLGEGRTAYCVRCFSLDCLEFCKCFILVLNPFRQLVDKAGYNMERGFGARESLVSNSHTSRVSSEGLRANNLP